MWDCGKLKNICRLTLALWGRAHWGGGGGGHTVNITLG